MLDKLVTRGALISGHFVVIDFFFINLLCVFVIFFAFFPLILCIVPFFVCFLYLFFCVFVPLFLFSHFFFCVFVIFWCFCPFIFCFVTFFSVFLPLFSLLVLYICSYQSRQLLDWPRESFSSNLFENPRFFSPEIIDLIKRFWSHLSVQYFLMVLLIYDFLYTDGGKLIWLWGQQAKLL